MCTKEDFIPVTSRPTCAAEGRHTRAAAGAGRRQRLVGSGCCAMTAGGDSRGTHVLVVWAGEVQRSRIQVLGQCMRQKRAGFRKNGSGCHVCIDMLAAHHGCLPPCAAACWRSVLGRRRAHQPAQLLQGDKHCDIPGAQAQEAAQESGREGNGQGQVGPLHSKADWNASWPAAMHCSAPPVTAAQL